MIAFCLSRTVTVIKLLCSHQKCMLAAQVSDITGVGSSTHYILAQCSTDCGRCAASTQGSNKRQKGQIFIFWVLVGRVTDT